LWLSIGQPQAQRRRAARSKSQTVERRSFGPGSVWIHGLAVSLHHAIVDSVFDVASAVLATKELLGVCFIFGEEEFGFPLANEPASSVSFVLDSNDL
jgi:hypothetical protein